MTSLRRLASVFIVLAACLLVSLALPVETWRTGRLAVPDLHFMQPGTLPAPPRRLWIDTDAACGHGPRTDVDDCLALLFLGRAPELEIAGVSTVFGNAALDVTDRTTRALLGQLSSERSDAIAVFRGSGAPITQDPGEPSPGRRALHDALELGQLTIVALGPLTNIAAALRARPDLRRNVASVVAVMGRRMGHLFHPSEGSGQGMLLGHGPIFRDFNFSANSEARARARRVSRHSTAPSRSPGSTRACERGSLVATGAGIHVVWPRMRLRISNAVAKRRRL
jgi:purine nucleosidase